MTNEFYDLAVPQFVQILRAQSRLLAKAETHCAENGLQEADWLAARLYPDMQPLAFQVRQLLNHSLGALARLRGLDYPRRENPESFPICRTLIDEATTEIRAIRPAELDGAADREVIFETPSGPLLFTGGAYLMSFAFPNFYFHASIAYALLRSLGLPIGKNDFLGGAGPATR